MIHQIRFEYLICSYLPGLPLSLAAYVLVLEPSLGSGYWTSYIVIVPLIAGLFVDGVRHSLALLWFKITPGNWWLLFWRDLTKANINEVSKYNEPVRSEIMSRYTIFYHVFEFFFNFCLSSLFAYVVILLHSKQICKDYEWVRWATPSLAFISFLISQSFLVHKTKLVNDFFVNSEE